MESEVSIAEDIVLIVEDFGVERSVFSGAVFNSLRQNRESIQSEGVSGHGTGIRERQRHIACVRKAAATAAAMIARTTAIIGCAPAEMANAVKKIGPPQGAKTAIVPVAIKA